ncbi:MAG: hypothetical protein QXX95_02240 [Nitrososphaerales archaeon]
MISRLISRPLGLTLLSLLIALLGTISLIGSIVLLYFSFSNSSSSPFLILSLLLLLIGSSYLVLAYGVWVGKSWAWTVTAIFTIFGSLFNFISLIVLFINFFNLIALILNLLILYYIFRPKVKAFFGKL